MNLLKEYRTPKELFYRTAEGEYYNSHSAADTGITEEAFILKHSLGKCTFVGYHIADDEYIVGKMWNKSEVINRGDPRLKTSENRYLKCQLYRMEIPSVANTDATVEGIAEVIDEREYDEKLNTGWINGYRLERLEDVLEEELKWY